MSKDTIKVIVGGVFALVFMFGTIAIVTTAIALPILLLIRWIL